MTAAIARTGTVDRTAWVDGMRVSLTPATLLGQGGEAEIYDLGDGRVLKWWKPPAHPDFDAQPAAQAAAAQRIADAPARLAALTALAGSWPAAVVAPVGLAYAGKRSKQIVGYVMPKVRGAPLHSYGEPRWRRDHVLDGNEIVAALVALGDAIAGLHSAGIVVGDCNDLNVLVDGSRVHLIDVDSYQLRGFPCSMYSERFLDPRLCDGDVFAPVRPHDRDSDWFAFAAMVLRTLLLVGPWGGVLRTAVAGHRALRRLSVLRPDITYPRAARRPDTLPEDLVAALRTIFEHDVRGPALRPLLGQLRFVRCPSCGQEHARRRCPDCQAAALVPPAVVHGRLRWQRIDRADVRIADGHVGLVGPVFLRGAALLRGTPLGPERIGSVLAGLTHAWTGAKLGVGFYRAGGYAVGFVFRPDRGVLDDRVALPPIRGQLVSTHATIGDDRAWLWLVCADAGRLTTTCVVIAADSRVLATETFAGAPSEPPPTAAWLPGITGACAAGPHLFVPTDDGIARIEIVAGAITQTRVFAETAPLVSAADRLALHPTGLDVLRRDDAIRLHLA